MIKRLRGFTLIELLIVIAILGTLAVVVLVALNPIQQLARTRDAGRISGVTQLGHAMEAYATSHNGKYVWNPVGTWMQQLVDAGEISSSPSLISYMDGGNGCPTNNNNGICYERSSQSGPMVIYAELESDSQKSNCTGTNTPWAVYSSADGRGGVVCGSGVNPGNQNFVN